MPQETTRRLAWKYLCWKKSAPHLRCGLLAHSVHDGSAQPRRLRIEALKGRV